MTAGIRTFPGSPRGARPAPAPTTFPGTPRGGASAPAPRTFPGTPRGGAAAHAAHAGHAKKKTTKSSPWTAAKKTKKAKKARGLSLGDVQCCAARAVAASLGCPVSDEAILALYWHTAATADAGAFIEATLEAACEHGLAGRQLARFGEPDGESAAILGLDGPGGAHAVFDDGESWWSWGQPYDPAWFAGAVVEEAWAVAW